MSWLQEKKYNVSRHNVNTNKERFYNMNCFQKYKSYTNTNVMPAFCRDMKVGHENYNSGV